MAIPASPPVSLSDIAAEYSDAAPYSLSDFLGKTGAPSAFPASMSDWYGLSATNVNLNNDTVSDFELSPTTAQSQWQLDNDGTVDIPQGTGSEYSWLLSGAAADYEARVTLVSGTLDLGTAGVWFNLGSDRTWGVQRSSFGTKTTVIDVEIRDVATSTVQATCRITLEATQDT